jgi:hypothetical protein
MSLFRDTGNEKMSSRATMGTISLKGKEIAHGSSKVDGYHGYHERSPREFGLQLDSAGALFETRER